MVRKSEYCQTRLSVVENALCARIICQPIRGFILSLCVWQLSEARLRVDERVRKSVVFIGAENERGFTPYGTALIGLVTFEDFGNTVIITAHHVVEDIPGNRVSVRLNRKDGSADTRKLQKSWLITFKDRAIDLCVFPISIDPSIYDFFAIH